MGSHDNIELHREELWWVNDAPCVIGLLRERNRASVSSIGLSIQHPSNNPSD